jgi:hypothetical protein
MPISIKPIFWLRLSGCDFISITRDGFMPVLHKNTFGKPITLKIYHHGFSRKYGLTTTPDGTILVQYERYERGY